MTRTIREPAETMGVPLDLDGRFDRDAGREKGIELTGAGRPRRYPMAFLEMEEFWGPWMFGK